MPYVQKLHKCECGFIILCEELMSVRLHVLILCIDMKTQSRFIWHVFNS